MKTLIDNKLLEIIVDRLSYQLIERYTDFQDTCIIGVQPRGTQFAELILAKLKEITGIENIPYGKLDITFYRDDFRQSAESFEPTETTINFSLENKKILLIDDVLYTGRTIRAAMDAMLDFGRPASVDLMVLINRRFSREVPIEADLVGRNVDAIASQKVKVNWGKESKVVLVNRND